MPASGETTMELVSAQETVGKELQLLLASVKKDSSTRKNEEYWKKCQQAAKGQWEEAKNNNEKLLESGLKDNQYFKIKLERMESLYRRVTHYIQNIQEKITEGKGEDKQTRRLWSQEDKMKQFKRYVEMELRQNDLAGYEALKSILSEEWEEIKELHEEILFYEESYQNDYFTQHIFKKCEKEYEEALGRLQKKIKQAMRLMKQANKIKLFETDICEVQEELLQEIPTDRYEWHKLILSKQWQDIKELHEEILLYEESYQNDYFIQETFKRYEHEYEEMVGRLEKKIQEASTRKEDKQPAKFWEIEEVSSSSMPNEDDESFEKMNKEDQVTENMRDSEESHRDCMEESLKLERPKKIEEASRITRMEEENVEPAKLWETEEVSEDDEGLEKINKEDQVREDMRDSKGHRECMEESLKLEHPKKIEEASRMTRMKEENVEPVKLWDTEQVRSSRMLNEDETRESLEVYQAPVNDTFTFRVQLSSDDEVWMQELWKKELQWDVTVPEEIQKAWSQVSQQLKCIEEIVQVAEFAKNVDDRTRLNTEPDAACMVKVSAVQCLTKFFRAPPIQGDWAWCKWPPPKELQPIYPLVTNPAEQMDQTTA